jgi:hypothetical protein
VSGSSASASWSSRPAIAPATSPASSRLVMAKAIRRSVAAPAPRVGSSAPRLVCGDIYRSMLSRCEAACPALSERSMSDENSDIPTGDIAEKRTWVRELGARAQPRHTITIDIPTPLTHERFGLRRISALLRADRTERRLPCSA